MTNNCFDCNGTGIDKDFGSPCYCGITPGASAPAVLTPAENELGALADWLGEQKWSEFAQSLSSFYTERGYLTPKQEASARSMKAKCDAKEAARAAAPAAAPAAPAAPADDKVRPPKPLWPGRYTIETPDGHRTFKIEVQASDARFAPGQKIISFLSGRDNVSDYTGCGFVTEDGRVNVWSKYRAGGAKHTTALLRDLAQFLADPDAAQATVQCARCGLDLTVPESIARGFGPECARRGLR